MKNKISVFTLVVLCLLTPVFARSMVLPAAAQKVLDNKYRDWRMAEVNKEIIDFYKDKQPEESLNSIKGDWNGDGKMDYAVQLQDRKNSEKKIIVVLIKSASGFDSYTLAAADCIVSVKKGSTGFDHDTNKSFRYKNDAITSLIWEKSATTYIWENRRFRGILTSD